MVAAYGYVAVGNAYGSIAAFFKVLNAGSYTIGGSYAGSNYKITFVEGTLEITPAEIDEAKTLCR